MPRFFQHVGVLPLLGQKLIHGVKRLLLDAAPGIERRKRYDIFGDALDNGGDKAKVFAKGDKVGKVITIKKPAKLNDINKARVAIFVCTADQEGGTKTYVNNIVQCPIGGSVPFSYTE